MLSDKFISILKEEMVLAEGCTEPIAIAYACALAKSYLKGTPTKINLELSSNVIKNVDGVVVPNSGGRVGVPTCALLGAFFGNHNQNLLVISNITNEQIEELKGLLEQKLVNIKLSTSPAKLYIKATISDGTDEALVEIIHTHTNVTMVQLNGTNLISVACNDGDFNSPLTDRKELSIKRILKYAEEITLDGELLELVKLMEEKNTAIAKEGLDNKYGLNVGMIMRENIKNGIYAADTRNMPSSLAASGSDARMSGCSLPVMSVAGSGNQGMTISLSIYEFARMRNVSEEKRLRAQILGLLTTIHIKTNVGRLSPYCGVVCASAGAAAGITYLLDGGYDEIASAIISTLSNLSGMLCDGAKNTCALKISTGITSAIDAAYIAMHKLNVGNVGIACTCVEETIKNIGLIANDALKQADECILGIMTRRG